MNLKQIETDALEQGVVGTVKKDIAEGQHKNGIPYLAGRAVGYALLAGIAFGTGYLLLGGVA